jgi:hypothetical protein
MPGKSNESDSGREGARALDYVKTQREVEAKGAARDASAKVERASRREGSGDSPKRQGDKLEKARDAAAGRSRSK